MNADRRFVRSTELLTRREVLRAGGLAGIAALVATPVARSVAEVAGARTFARSELDEFVHQRMRAGRLPGLAASVVRDGRVVWSGAYGWAHIRAERRVQLDTPFMLASVSKTVLATAVMQGVEDGVLDLHADVNDVLPFRVRLPDHPRRPITTWHLLTHTSGIRDRWSVWDDLYSNGDSTMPLGVFLRRYLEPGGSYYRAGNFHSFAPGQEYRYGNIAASLAAYVLEVAAGKGFDEWCEDRIFYPLGMARTAWHLDDLPRRDVAMPYRWSAARDRYVAYGQYGYPDYPDGALRVSASDVARHLLMFMGGGTLDGVRLLQPDTVREMRRSQGSLASSESRRASRKVPDVLDGQGLIWYRSHRRGRVLIGHNGGDYGVATVAFYDPDAGTGVVVLGNGNWRRDAGRWPLMQIMNRLFERAGRL
jgi:CubicO group peptidase (beta-lactamase class C family)